MTSAERLAEIRERLERAQLVVSEICEGKRMWDMSIPARPDHDPDIIIWDALADGLKVLTQLDEVLDVIRDFRDHGVRHDLNPTGMMKDCGCFEVWEGRGGWHAYLKSADAYVRIRARDFLASHTPKEER